MFLYEQNNKCSKKEIYFNSCFVHVLLCCLSTVNSSKNATEDVVAVLDDSPIKEVASGLDSPKNQFHISTFYKKYLMGEIFR
jgi:hypothetical protein